MASKGKRQRVNYKEIVETIAGQIGMPLTEVEKLPQVMSMAFQQMLVPPTLVTIAIDTLSGQLKNVTLSNMPQGGTVEELTMVSKAVSQVVESLQQRTVEAAKAAGKQTELPESEDASSETPDPTPKTR